MKSFHDIESLRHICEWVRGNCEYHGREVRPTIKFRGTVKLHGSNGGVRVSPTGVVAQGRNRVLTIQEDSYGFAHFVAGRQDDFKLLAAISSKSLTSDVTLYGEWCGIGIQKKVGVASLPKMFVIFSVFNHTTDEWLDINDVRPIADELAWLNNQNIYLITQVPTYEVEIDFNDPTRAAELVSQYTLQVEEACPFANSQLFRAYNKGENIGIGEGIVWVSYGYPDRLVFKTKGEKHKKGGTRERVEVDPEKVANINALVDLLLPEWRLEQGFSYLRDNNIALATTSTGDYLKWIAKDILKEEADRIAANPFSWKEIQGTVMVRAREYYFAHLDEMAGLTSAAETV